MLRENPTVVVLYSKSCFLVGLIEPRDVNLISYSRVTVKGVAKLRAYSQYQNL